MFYDTLYRHGLNYLCDWYIESIKQLCLFTIKNGKSCHVCWWLFRAIVHAGNLETMVLSETGARLAHGYPTHSEHPYEVSTQRLFGVRLLAEMHAWARFFSTFKLDKVVSLNHIPLEDLCNFMDRSHSSSFAG